MRSERNLKRFPAADPCGESIIVIPALEPAPALILYVKSLLDRGFSRIVVIDDGSSPRCADIFAALEQTQGCLVLHHGVNRGKGAALKTALRCCLEQNWGEVYRRMIMVDADGQHAVPDVCRLAEASEAHPEAYVLGVRDFGKEVVPARSRFGNRLTSSAFRLLYGRYLQDTQTGLRALPAGLWNWGVSVSGERFEYETNCLIQAVRHGVPMAEVEIETLYFDKNAGTHYKTFRDSWPILKTLLHNLGAYAFSSACFAVVDLAVFILLEAVILKASTPAVRLLVATVAARGLASLVSHLVSRTKGLANPRRFGRTDAAYRCWQLLQTLASASLVVALDAVLSWPAVWLKVLVDVTLNLIAYRAELRWRSKAV